MALKGNERNLLDLSECVLNGVTVLLALFTGYVVIGGVWTGQISILPDTHPIVRLSLLAFVILLIGGLEGLQISVSNLQKKDLTELRNEYPGALTLHESFKNKEDVAKRFFGGRQFLIVALVFIASRLTTFPDMQTLPFTSISLPGILTPWFPFLFFDLGLLGALFVLWLGNLTAQFMATDYPVEFLNVPGMGVLFALCLCVDKIRLPRPAAWLSAYFSETIADNPSGTTDRSRSSQFGMLPVSSEERWRRELESESGFALTKITHEWHLYQDRVRIFYEATYLIGRDGIETIIDDNFLLPQHFPLVSQNSFSWNAYVIREAEEAVDATETSCLPRWFPQVFHVEEVTGGDGEQTKETYQDGGEPVQEEREENDGAADDELLFDKSVQTIYQSDVPFDNYVLSFSNRKGSFDRGVKIRVAVEAELTASPVEFTSDQFLIDHPCAELEIRIEFEDDFDAINSPHLLVSNPVHEQTPGSEDRDYVRLGIQSAQDGSVFSTYSETFPRDRSRYVVIWDVD